MTNKIKNELEYKLILILLYFILNIIGFSIIFFYSPRDLLFKENSSQDKIKLNLYKDFAKNIYANINTPLIKNLTLTKDDEECPQNFEQLIIKNQYYGNFSKFYGNKSICIERFKDSEYTFRNLLKLSEKEFFKKDKRECGKLETNSDLYVYITNDTMCPLNHIEINGISRAINFGNYSYQMSNGDQYLIPIYGYDIKYPVIIDLEIVNNYRVCLEKYFHNNEKDLSCEFPDNNECFIIDNYEQIYNLVTNEEDYILNVKNIMKWNNPNYQEIYNFCEPNLKLQIFALSYITFTQESLKEFESLFPPNDYNNNPLYKVYKAYKHKKNVDRFFKLIFVIILMWSFLHFILQIMLCVEKFKIRHLFITNGIILFIFKLISYFGILIYYFYFLNQVQIVNITMLDEPRNKILEYYSSSRKLFIIKSFFLCFIGFIFISVDLIIFTLIYTIKWGENSEINKLKSINDISNVNDVKPENIKKSDNETNINEIKNGGKQIIKEEKELINKPKNKIISKTSIIEPNENKDFIDYNKIELKFICKHNVNKSYMILTKKQETFENVIEKLKEQYPELKDMKMKVFNNCDTIINKKQTINENNININNNTIVIQT